MKAPDRIIVDKFSTGWMALNLTMILLLPLIICAGLILKSLPILQTHSFWDLMLGSGWHPGSGEFGFLPFIVSSVIITILSFILSAPVCLLAAVYLTQYAGKWLFNIMQPVIDILAGIPSVVYGVWGILVVIPIVSQISGFLHQPTTGYSILAGGIILSVMTIPFVLNMLIEVFRTIPVELKEASLSVGATLWETIKYVLIRKAFPGIFAAFGMGISKAFGETIAVLMVVGNVVQIPENIFQPGYPLPALIANNYGEMMSVPLYDSALMFAALILFLIILLFNLLSRVAIYRGENL